jgi:hypothetical protein
LIRRVMRYPRFPIRTPKENNLVRLLMMKEWTERWLG